MNVTAIPTEGLSTMPDRSARESSLEVASSHATVRKATSHTADMARMDQTGRDSRGGHGRLSLHEEALTRA